MNKTNLGGISKTVVYLLSELSALEYRASIEKVDCIPNSRFRQTILLTLFVCNGNV